MIDLRKCFSVLVVPALVLTLVGCSNAAASNPAPTAPSAVVATRPASVATAPASQPTAAQPAATGGGGSNQGALLARGKVIFEKEAGGVGCQYCHGMDGKGTLGPGVNIRGKKPDEIRKALQTVELMMQVVKNLSSDDIDAVAAYLDYLATQP